MPHAALRLPPPVLERVDALIERRNARAGWAAVDRSKLLRELVERGLELAEAERAAEPTAQG